MSSTEHDWGFTEAIVLWSPYSCAGVVLVLVLHRICYTHTHTHIKYKENHCDIVFYRLTATVCRHSNLHLARTKNTPNKHSTVATNLYDIMHSISISREFSHYIAAVDVHWAQIQIRVKDDEMRSMLLLHTMSTTTKTNTCALRVFAKTNTCESV